MSDIPINKCPGMTYLFASHSYALAVLIEHILTLTFAIRRILKMPESLQDCLLRILMPHYRSVRLYSFLPRHDQTEYTKIIGYASNKQILLAVRSSVKGLSTECVLNTNQSSLPIHQ